MAEQIQIDTSGFTNEIKPTTSIDTSKFTNEITIEKPELKQPEIKETLPVSNQIDTSKFTNEIKTLEIKTDSPTKLKTDDYSTLEKIRYGIDKQNNFFGNTLRVIKSGVQAALDPNLEFKDYAVRNYNEEQRELKEKYGNLASGAYDDDNVVKAASFATFMVDPFYLFAYLSPWGRAATATYKGLAAVSGGTVGLDVLMNQLATTGEISPKELAGTTAAATVLGPLSVKAFRALSSTFPGAKKEQLAQVIKVIENKKAKEIGVSVKDFHKLQKIAGDKELLSLNKQINAKTSDLLKPLRNQDKALNALEERIENKLKVLKKQKLDIKGVGAKKKKSAIDKKITAQNKILETKTEEFNKAKNEFWKKVTAKDKEIIDLQAKREYTFLKLLKQNQSLTRNAAEFAIGMSLRPAFGAGVGYAFGRLWGKEDQELRNWMLIGATLGGTQKLIQRSGKVFSTGEKNMLDKIIFNEATKLSFQKARELLSTTSATKLKAFGGETEKIGLKLFQNLDGPVSQNSASGYADKLKRDFAQKAFEISSKLTTAEESAAIRIVRGSKEKASQKVSTAAKEIRNWLNRFQDEYTKVGLGLRKTVDGKEVRVENIKDYFPRVWNWQEVSKNPEKFRDVVAKILMSVDKQKYKTLESAKKEAAKFYKGIQKGNQEGFYDSSTVSKLIADTMAGIRSKSSNINIIKNLPLDEHITKDRILKGPYAKVEKILEENNYLVNDINSTLNNLITRSADSIGFAAQFGNKGQLLQSYITGIVNKYKDARGLTGKLTEAEQQDLATKEIKLVFDHINAYFGRYGQIREGIAKTGAGILSTLANLNMLERVSIASLGDLVQPFTNSNNFRAWLGGFMRTTLRQSKQEGLSNNLGLRQGKVLENQLLKTLTPLDKNPTLAANVMDNPGNLRKINEKAFKLLGLQWITGFARRFAYNTGMVDALTSAQKLARYVSAGNSINTRKGLRLVDDLSKYGISVEDGLRLGKFKSIEEAATKKAMKELLNKSGITAANRDALIPQVSNRLIFTQSRDPVTRLFGQFLSWTLAKSAQTNKLLTRIENGDARTLVKLLAALPVYGGIQQLREIAKHGEIVTDTDTELDKWYSESLRLSGLSGTLPELFVGRLTGPGSREPWYLFAPGFNVLTDIGFVAKDAAMGDWDKASRRFFQRIAPGPIFQSWIKKLWSDDSYQPVNDFTNIRQNFNQGDIVEKIEDNKGKEEDNMNIKNATKAAVVAGALASGVNAEISKAQDNFLLPKAKPKIEVVQKEKPKDYSKLSDLPEDKKKFLLDSATVIYQNNQGRDVPSDILIAIALEETGYGTSRFYKEGNNYFNMVAEKGDDKIKAKGDNTQVAKFESPSESIDKFYTWVETKPHYKNVRETLEKYKQGEATKNDIIDAISDTGWAENPKWSDNVKSILKARVNGKHSEELKNLENSLFKK